MLGGFLLRQRYPANARISCGTVLHTKRPLLFVNLILTLKHTSMSYFREEMERETDPPQGSAVWTVISEIVDAKHRRRVELL